jgi:hypothetical protein
MLEIQRNQLRRVVSQVIDMLRHEIKWKPGKDWQHLQTRIGYGHLPADSTMAGYENIIRGILADKAAEIYVYTWETNIYPTVVGDYNNEKWLVMFSLSGIMETAFPPTDVEEYLSNPRFQKLGLMGEL